MKFLKRKLKVLNAFMSYTKFQHLMQQPSFYLLYNSNERRGDCRIFRKEKKKERNENR